MKVPYFNWITFDKNNPSSDIRFGDKYLILLRMGHIFQTSGIQKMTGKKARELKWWNMPKFLISRIEALRAIDICLKYGGYTID